MLTIACIAAAGASFPSPGMAVLGAQPDGKASEAVPAQERPVSLTGEPTSRRAALEDICRQADIALSLDAEALGNVGIKLDETVSVKVTNEPLQDALVRLIDWRLGAYRVVRDGKLFVTTRQATNERTLRHLPDWLKPLFNKGLLATVDDSGSVTTLTAGKVVTDELLAKLKSLPKLRKLNIDSTTGISPLGLADLASFPALENLTLYCVKREGTGLGDDALRRLVALKSLRELYIAECGTTDAGVQFLESMPQLTHLALRNERTLTDAALTSIVKIKGLKHLDLSGSAGTITSGGLRELAALQDLEVLRLQGHALSGDFFTFPKLTVLSVGGVGDSAAAGIAQCRNLTSLELTYTAIGDDSLRLIATLPGLHSLNISSAKISDTGISHLKSLLHLEHLQLRAINVSDEALMHMAQMKTLTRLDLYGSGAPGVHLGECFTANGLKQLKDLPKLRTLWLTNLQLHDGFSVLQQLSHLRELTLMMTNIRQDELDALGDTLPDATICAASGDSMRQPKRGRANP